MGQSAMEYLNGLGNSGTADIIGLLKAVESGAKASNQLGGELFFNVTPEHLGFIAGKTIDSEGARELISTLAVFYGRMQGAANVSVRFPEGENTTTGEDIRVASLKKNKGWITVCSIAVKEAITTYFSLLGFERPFDKDLLEQVIKSSVRKTVPCKYSSHIECTEESALVYFIDGDRHFEMKYTWEETLTVQLSFLCNGASVAGSYATVKQHDKSIVYDGALLSAQTSGLLLSYFITAGAAVSGDEEMLKYKDVIKRVFGEMRFALSEYSSEIVDEKACANLISAELKHYEGDGEYYACEQYDSDLTIRYNSKEFVLSTVLRRIRQDEWELTLVFKSASGVEVAHNSKPEVHRYYLTYVDIDEEDDSSGALLYRLFLDR